MQGKSNIMKRTGGIAILALSFVLSLPACKSKVAVTVEGGDVTGISVTNFDLLVLKEGDTVNFTGTSIRPNLELKIDGIAVPITIASETAGSFVFPAGVKVGLRKADFMVRTKLVSSVDFLADTAGDGLPLFPVDASQVCIGTSYRNKDGEVATGSMVCQDFNLEFCKVDGELGCVTSKALPAIAKSAVEPEMVKVHHSVTLAGMPGTMIDCDENTKMGCYIETDSGMKAVVTDSLDKSKILSSYSGLGAAGTLNACTSSGSNDCYANGSYFAATDCTANASACYLPVYQSGTQNLKAVDFDSITEGLIKKDATIAGVVGKFPNATYPLPVASGDTKPDLTTANFLAKIVLAAEFAWFDRAGNRLSHAGDVNIVPEKFKDSVNVFNVGGSLKVPAAWDVRVGSNFGNAQAGKLRMRCNNRVNTSVWDISLPPTLNDDAAVPLEVDETADTIQIHNHGFVSGDAVRMDYYGGLAAPAPLQADTIYFAIRIDANKFQLAANQGDALAGTPVPIDISAEGFYVTAYKTGGGTGSYFDSIDDFNNGGALPSTAFAASSQTCEGLESTVDDEKVWKDAGTVSCASDPSNCRIADKISGLEWSKLHPTLGSGESTWAIAVASCDSLVYDGKSDWRLPTQKELIAAYTHGMRSVASANWVADASFDNSFWAATTYSLDVTKAWSINLAKGSAAEEAKTQIRKVICVR